MVGAPGPSPLAPPGGPSSTFLRWWWVLSNLQLQHLPGARRRRFHVGGGRPRTFSSDTSQGSANDVLTLMVGAHEPSAPHLPGARRRRFHVDGGRVVDCRVKRSR
jgi:hypothetical protein